MADKTKHKINDLSMNLNNEDMSALYFLLIKAGYAARIGKEHPKGQTLYFVEYWEEAEDE